MQGVQCWRGNGLRKMPIKVTVGCHPSAKTMFILNQIRYLCFSVCRQKLLHSWYHCNLLCDQLLPHSQPLFPSHFSFPDFSIAGPSSDPCGASGGDGSALPCPFPGCLVLHWAACQNRGAFPMQRVLQGHVGKGRKCRGCQKQQWSYVVIWWENECFWACHEPASLLRDLCWGPSRPYVHPWL